MTVTQKSPTHSNALVYFPPILDRFDYLNRFAETFEDLGRVVISEGLLSRSMP